MFCFLVAGGIGFKAGPAESWCLKVRSVSRGVRGEGPVHVRRVGPLAAQPPLGCWQPRHGWTGRCTLQSKSIPVSPPPPCRCHSQARIRAHVRMHTHTSPNRRTSVHLSQSALEQVLGACVSPPAHGSVASHTCTAYSQVRTSPSTLGRAFRPGCAAKARAPEATNAAEIGRARWPSCWPAKKKRGTRAVSRIEFSNPCLFCPFVSRR
jgi:hypothetical protein